MAPRLTPLSAHPLPVDDLDLRRLQGDVTDAVRRSCPPWLASQADDIAQAAMLRVLRARERGATALNASWLRSAATSAVIDEVRHRRALREDPLDQAGDTPATASEGQPERRAHARQVGAAILSCLAPLPDDRRRAVSLYLHGHPVPELGRLLGWDPKRAENLVYRGLAALRDCLRRKGIEP